MEKPSLAIVPLTCCGACMQSIYEDRELMKTITRYRIIYWPGYAEGELGDAVDAAIIVGVARTRRDYEAAEKMYREAGLVVMYGTCSVYGGIPGLTALVPREELGEDYADTAKPPAVLRQPSVLAPGCPPSASVRKRLAEILEAYLRGEKPDKTVFLGNTESLCRNCPLRPRDPGRIEMPGIKRVYEGVSMDKCFLEQGILCLGPVTSASCNHDCIRMGLPCTGCAGPVPGIDDAGLRYIGAIGSILMVKRERQVMFPGLARELDKIHDPMGLLYKYTLPRAKLTQLALIRRGLAGGGEK